MKNVVGKFNRRIAISKELIEASGGILTLGVVTAKVQVSPLNQSLWDLLQDSGKSQKKYDPKTVSDITPIKALRDTYKNLGVKISSYQGSNEALLKRILSDKGLYQINTVVDINNYISITSLRSVGSYDLSKLSGDIEFRPGKTGETYIGTTKRAINLEHLPVLCDQDGPFGSPTSDSNKALIQNSTTDLITVIFSFDGEQLLKEQMHEMTRLLTQYAGATNVHTYSIKDLPQELLVEDITDVVETIIKE
ncbi:MAG: hypothetical protein LN569_02310 [Rickettsia endosymbiont of Labidopullus appendiculatus]|nr:hypothetical protein [Rickettsia endosymbiont of Labidopullus appendiculatus]